MFFNTETQDEAAPSKVTPQPASHAKAITQEKTPDQSRSPCRPSNPICTICRGAAGLGARSLVGLARRQEMERICRNAYKPTTAIKLDACKFLLQKLQEYIDWHKAELSSKATPVCTLLGHCTAD